MDSSNNLDEILEVIGQILIRCFAMGVLVLLFWWGALVLAGDLAYSIHSWFVPITRTQFNVIHYTAGLLTKAAVFILFFFPYLSILLVLRKRSDSPNGQ